MKRGVFMELQAFRDCEIAKIYKNKLMYSIIKYEKQNNDFKDFCHDKYCNALTFNNSSFDNSIIEEVKEYLDKEMNEYNRVVAENQEVIDLIADELVRNFTNEAVNLSNDLEKCRFLFEYVAKIMHYDFEARKYNRLIPFGNDYDFEFYNGVPISNSYKGLLVTKCGLSDDICNLMVFLGRELNLDIDTVVCQNHYGNYYINSVNIDGNISYMDVTSVIRKKNKIDEACLVDRSTLIQNRNYTNIAEEGVLIPLDYSKPYDFCRLIKADNKNMPTAKYLETDIFEKKKTS